MKLNEVLLAQLDRETPATRKLLERVPDGKPDWKPHPKSMPLGYLSTLIAIMPGWIASMVERDHIDLAGGSPPPPSTAAERLALFDKTVADARRALSGTNDDHLMLPWQLRAGDKLLDEKPRYMMIADTISHLAHHRGQLTVYLRLNEVLLPSVYGPTADEGWKT